MTAIRSCEHNNSLNAGWCLSCVKELHNELECLIKYFPTKLLFTPNYTEEEKLKAILDKYKD